MVIKKMKLLASNAAQLESESAFDVLARAQRRASAGHPVINLGIGQPDFQTSAHIVEAAVKALQDGQHGYTAAAGTVELRSGVAAYYERCFGLDVDPESVLVVPGGKVTMAFAMLLLGESGREILYPDPGFPIYRSLAGYSGARAGGFDANSWVPAAVISNDTRTGIERFLAHHKLSTLFQQNWSADDSPRKPDPEAVARLCTRLSLDPANCALIGDAETDLQMAVDAGIGVVVGYRGGWSTHPRLPSARHVMDNGQQLTLEADP